MLYNIYSRIDNAEVRLPNSPGSRIFHPLPKWSILTAEQSPQAGFRFPIPAVLRGAFLCHRNFREFSCNTKIKFSQEEKGASVPGASEKIRL